MYISYGRHAYFLHTLKKWFHFCCHPPLVFISNVNVVRRLRIPRYCVKLVAVLVHRPVLIDTTTLSKLSC